MALVRGLIDRAVLVCGVVAGGTIPSFVAQYRQRLGGALDQITSDLAPFQQIADVQFGGSLDALVRHHLNSTDTAFRSEGQAIDGMLKSADALSESVQALNTDLFHQLSYLATHAQPNFVKATWGNFVPAFSLSFDGLIVAAGFGASLWLIFLALWFVASRLLGFARTPVRQAPHL